MPTRYTGRVIVGCGKDVCIVDPVRENVVAECLNCSESSTVLLDLDDKTIAKKEKPAVKKTAKNEVAAEV